MNRHTRHLTTAVAALAGATLALGAGSLSPADAAVAHRTPSTYTATPQGFQAVDNAPAGDSAGDEIVDTFALARHGRRVGTIVQHCVLADPATGLAECSGSVFLPGGHLTLGGGVDGSEVTRMPVLGGTGRYRGARGVAVFRPHGDVVRVALHLGGAR